MKGKKKLFSLIGLSAVVVIFSIVWVNHGNTYPREDYYSSGKPCGSKKGASFHDGGGGKYGNDWCKSGALSEICNNLPCPAKLLHKTEELGLNDDQVTQLKKLKSSSKKARIKKVADIQILEIELKELLDNKSIDKKAVDEKIDAIGNLRTQIIKSCINTKLTARELLTNEQLQKLENTKKSCDMGTKAPSVNEEKEHQGSSTKHDNDGTDSHHPISH